MDYNESKNWKAPALTWPAGMGMCEKDTAITSAADRHPPRKIVLNAEKSTLPGTPPADVKDQQYDGDTQTYGKEPSAAGYASRAARNI
jgi:hypothetical protein